ncbi:hypothetical protein L1049_027002 [Liquidambar formosana]|uniref:Uncharacterized protein n=1 Tax=Liquidambar formosana TaxID=63359 RepID=A0AAP0NDP3_LIQFO
MAHLLPNYVCPNISKGPYNESSCRYISISGKTRSLERKRGLMVQCCSSSSTSSAEEVGLVEKVQVDGNLQVGKGHFGCLISEYGWKVRRLVEEEEEMRMAVQVQAEAFHEPVALFNDFFFQFFQAEVLSGLAYKLRNSPPGQVIKQNS